MLISAPYSLKRSVAIMFEKPQTKSHHDQEVISWDMSSRGSTTSRIITEEPLSIRVQGKPYAVVMRTPGEELNHVAGFCLGEGIVDNMSDITALGFCDGADTNVVTITLTEARRTAVASYMDRRNYVSQTSCGICGKEIVDDLIQHIEPRVSKTIVDGRRAVDIFENLKQYQPIHQQTRASHASMLCHPDYSILSVSEDVGRHNALDKAIGRLFRSERLIDARVLLLSSRTSYELVQKAGRAQIPIVLSVSRPTSLAVSLAKKLGMTLACLGRPQGLLIICGAQRICL